MIEWITSNWQIVTIGILVVDKLVALSPSKMDDLLWTPFKNLLYKITGRK